MQKIPRKYYPHFIVLAVFLLMSTIVSIALTCKSDPIYEVKADADVIQISSRRGMIDNPDIAMNSSGNTVIVWQDKNGKDYEIYMQLFDGDGSPIGLPGKVNDFGWHDQKNPRAAISESGDFVVVWQSYNQDGQGSGIFGQRFSHTGKKTGSEFRVNDQVLENQINPDVAMSKNGNFAIAWTGEIEDGSSRNIFAQFFDTNGNKIGNEFQVNAYDVGSQDRVSVSVDDFNNIMFAWQGQKDENWNIFARKFNWDGIPSTQQDTLVNMTSEYNQTNPHVTIAGVNKFMVVWENESMHEILEDTLLQNINGQVLINNGQKSGTQFQVSEPVFGHQHSPDLVQISPSEMLVVWENYDKFNGCENCWGILGRMINTNGVLNGEVFILNPNDSKWNKTPVITSDGNGVIGVVWTILSRDEEKKTLYYKRNISM